MGGQANVVDGKIKQGERTLFNLKGKWDTTMTLVDSSTKQESVCFYSMTHN